MILAVDGGATKTVALLFDEESFKIKGVGLAGSSNFAVVGERKAEESLRKAISEAEGDKADKAVFCLAGIGDSEEDTKRGIDLVRRIFLNSQVFNDGVGAYRATNLFEDGGVFAPGTGSVAFYQKNGESHRVGGWSWIFGDEGSASWIAKTAITYATRVVDGIEESSELPKAIEEYFKLPFREAVIRLSKDQDKRLIASFAVMVDSLAMKGDPLALRVMNEAADYIVRMIDRLRKEGGKVSVIGGVMNSKIIRSVVSPLGVEIFYSYQAVLGGIVLAGVKMSFEERNKLAKELTEKIYNLPEEELKSYLFINPKLKNSET
ncbi:BadF/BadG/BcrA/BcrD ATPase family protein [Acidianus sp. HS-5]|uniref:BadF/BadG/BcrA/BcrD ATPase family protein n=1 Tax=Acidianus sp. HS-5 TaxID=2886040 RepID=UPI001F305E48|nr:BadF/BadG/BcrA/BcrD ATPase family protein [Acidianus sp. HS-5]BDC17982.1 ATPase [Acidianus sp. HS-5]